MFTISAFARRVGLTPSALRFYDDCAVLRPARVDPATGYRYYSSDQEERATLLRKLRAAGLPLAEVTVVLDGSPADAEDVLHRHARRLRDEADAAQAALGEVRRSLLPHRTEVALGGAELVSALRQVAPSAARSTEIPALACVLIEVADTEMRFVATDRYRLAVREVTPPAVEGVPVDVLVPADALLDVTAWAARQSRITVAVTPGQVRLTAAADTRKLPTVDTEYPDYRAMLAALDPPVHRVLTGRIALRDALAGTDADRIVLRAGTDTLVVGTTPLPAMCSAPLRIAFDPAVLGSALEASVGPDVLLEIAAPDRPVLVRSADQGSFSTLVMPVRLG